MRITEDDGIFFCADHEVALDYDMEAGEYVCPEDGERVSAVESEHEEGTSVRPEGG